MSDEIQTSEADSGGDAISAFVNEDPSEKPERDEVEAAPEEEASTEEEPEEGKSKPKAKAKEEPAPTKTYRVKVAGKEEDVPADALEAAARALKVDPEMLARGAQMFRAGQEKAREAAALEKKARELEAKLKQDPRALLREMLGAEGLSKLSVDVIRELMEEEELQRSNPQEIERRRAQAELDKVKAEREQIAKEKEAQEAQEFAAKEGDRIGSEIKAALDAAKIPKSPFYVKRIAALMMDALDAGADAEGLDVADFVPVALEEAEAEHAALFESLTGEEVIARFPKMADKVRQAYANKARRPAPPPRRQTNGDARPEERAPARRVGLTAAMSDWVKNG